VRSFELVSCFWGWLFVVVAGKFSAYVPLSCRLLCVYDGPARSDVDLDNVMIRAQSSKVNLSYTLSILSMYFQPHPAVHWQFTFYSTVSSRVPNRTFSKGIKSQAKCKK
jgi:hypothetical protein